MDSYPKGSQAHSWPKPLGPHFPLSLLIIVPRYIP